MGWLGELNLQYRREGERTVALDRHHGPLRVLQRLYPEGDAVCHHVLVHPPGGVVGGDVLAVQADLASGTHALITTPGATRFYRSNGPAAVQRIHARVADGARLEWLPLEAIAYDGCVAENRLHFDLAPGAEMMGWDMLALGLPAAGAHWRHGSYLQSLTLPGLWLEHAQIRADDHRLLDSPLGWAGRRVLGTLWFAAGTALPGARAAALLESVRELIEADAAPGEAGATASLQAGATATHEAVVVLRVLAARVEPAMQLLVQAWSRWRMQAWGLPACAPRVWRT
ncbi:MAG: urease accessory protein UreD [Burkholderiales bacterium]